MPPVVPSPLFVGAGVIHLAARWVLGVPVDASADLAQVAPWRWALFAYVGLSVGGSMHLSASDLRGTRRGVITLSAWLAAAVNVVAAVALFAARRLVRALW